MQTFDLSKDGLRALNSSLHALKGQTNMTAWEVINPKGAHAIAAGVDAPVEITVRGSTGYYCAGMNKLATIRVKGSETVGMATHRIARLGIGLVPEQRQVFPNLTVYENLVLSLRGSRGVFASLFLRLSLRLR